MSVFTPQRDYESNADLWKRMSVSEDDGTTTQELEFDMWEGQFEFLGNQFNGDRNDVEFEQVPVNGHRIYDRSADLLLSWRPRKNGLKKSEAQRWYEDIAQHVQMLQQQMNVLADNQTHTDERYTRAKQDNATLQARILMLEEQLREVELRSEERLAEEERRHRELVARVDREKQLQVENCSFRLQTLELENNSLKEETTRFRSQVERLRVEKTKLEDKLLETEASLSSVNEELARTREQERKYREQANASQQLVEELSIEIEKLQNERTNAEMLAAMNSQSNNEPSPLQSELETLRHKHKNLQESYDELQAVFLTKSVEEGRNLLTSAGPTSLAAELQLEAMTHDDLGERAGDDLKIRTALKEAQEVNAQLRSYIDGILLLIVDNCPRLLEVKRPPPGP